MKLGVGLTRNFVSFGQRIIFELGMDLDNELDTVEEIAGDNPKNYQVW